MNTMFYKHKGVPEEGELVLCTVKKILYHSVFVYLDNYENVDAMIHISEIAPGRIRNLRDYVREGKKLVCKVLKVYPGKRQVDLSLRRVSLNQRVKKLNEIKQEQKAEKILELVGKQLGVSLADMYKKVGYSIIENYGRLYPFFQDVVLEGEDLFKELKVDKKYAEALTKVIKKIISPPQVKIYVELTIQSFASDGIERIKSLLQDLIKAAEKESNEIDLIYLGAPKYKLVITARDYKEAENVLGWVKEHLDKQKDKLEGTISYTRKDE